MLANDLGEDIDDIKYLCAGINHMAFYQEFKNLVPAKTFTQNLKNLETKFLMTKKLSSRTKKLKRQKYLHEKVRYEILNRLGYFVTSLVNILQNMYLGS